MSHQMKNLHTPPKCISSQPLDSFSESFELYRQSNPPAIQTQGSLCDALGNNTCLPGLGLAESQFASPIVTESHELCEDVLAFAPFNTVSHDERA